MNLTQFTHGIFSLMLPGTMCLVLAFFLLLHAWQNAFAEMLRFGDRLFYKVLSIDINIDKNSSWTVHLNNEK